MKRLLFIIGLCCWASVANAAWVVSVVIDADKTAAPSVGTATATFTDTDNSEFVFSQRATLTVANGNAFVNAAIAARNAWQSKKTTQNNAQNVLITNFTTAGETATGAPLQ
jgi:hypothetical protein